jgi:hypothetical protein
MSTIFVSVSSLPSAVKSVLSSNGYGKKDIGIKAQESFTFVGGAYGDGYRAWAVLMNLETGESKSFIGSWGGSNMFTKSHVDDDQTIHNIPVNGIVIEGQEGRWVSASIIVHANNMPKYLPAVSEITDAEGKILYYFSAYTSAGRKAVLNDSHTLAIDSLVTRGFLKRNKAGSTAITTKGKNALTTIL